MIQEVIDAVIEAAKKWFEGHPPDVHRYVTYVSADTVAGRHIVSYGGRQKSGVLAYAHVTGLVAGNKLEVVHYDQAKRMTIVGKL